MARPPATPIDKDLGSERVTLTMAELDARIAQAVAGQMALMAAGRRIEPARRDLPTQDEADAMCEARIADGISPVAIETDKGWYAHPLVGTSADQVEVHNAKLAKKAAAKKAKRDTDAED